MTEANRTEDTWVDVKVRLPDTDRKVLVCWLNQLGNSRRTCAEYIAARSMSGETFDSDTPDDWFDVDESGTSWVPEGWYEVTETSEQRLFEDLPVTHWVELPKVPYVK